MSGTNGDPMAARGFNEEDDLNKLVFPPELPNSFPTIPEHSPSKPVDDVAQQNDAQLDNTDGIVTGAFPQPLPSPELPPSSSEPPVLSPNRKNSPGKKRKTWNIYEHVLFLRGIEIYGRSDWRNISRYGWIQGGAKVPNWVKTRLPSQIASHAQKFFNQRKPTEKLKKRSSIHDIASVADGLRVIRAQEPSPSDLPDMILDLMNSYTQPNPSNQSSADSPIQTHSSPSIVINPPPPTPTPSHSIIQSQTNVSSTPTFINPLNPSTQTHHHHLNTASSFPFSTQTHHHNLTTASFDPFSTQTHHHNLTTSSFEPFSTQTHHHNLATSSFNPFASQTHHHNLTTSSFDPYSTQTHPIFKDLEPPSDQFYSSIMGFDIPVPTFGTEIQPPAARDVRFPVPTFRTEIRPPAARDVRFPVPTFRTEIQPPAARDVRFPVPTFRTEIQPPAARDVRVPVPTPVNYFTQAQQPTASGIFPSTQPLTFYGNGTVMNANPSAPSAQRSNMDNSVSRDIFGNER